MMQLIHVPFSAYTLNYNHNSKFYLARVDDIIMGNENNPLNTISLNDDLRASFSAEINKNKKIKTNDSLISALIEQY